MSAGVLRQRCQGQECSSSEAFGSATQAAEMGVSSAKKCCNSATIGNVGRQTIGAGENDVRLKSTKVFKNEYLERAKMVQGGKVVEVMHKHTSQAYALRKLPLNVMPCQNPDDLGKHCAALANLEHPHLCKFVTGFQDRNDLYMIYEKADPTTLFDHVRDIAKLTEEDAADYLHQVTMALALAHSQKIYHGRLSPSSIILSLPLEDDEEEEGAQLKICDMGQAWYTRPAPHEASQSAKNFRAEKYCVSPDLAAGDLPVEAEAGSYYPKGADKHDMWGLGCIVFHMLTGLPPFQKCNDRLELMDAIQNEGVDMNQEAWSKLSSESRDAVEKLLKVNPQLRLSAAHLLKHPFIQVAKTSFPKKRMVQLLNNLKINATNCQFTRFVLRVIAEQLPADGKQAVTVEQAFRCLDSNGDGVLSVQEVVKGLERYLNLSQKEQEDLFGLIDRDGSGTLNVNEFLSATIDQRRAKSLPVLWQAFNAFDKDQSGSVTFDEIDAIVMELEGALMGKEQLITQCQDIRTELAAVSDNGAIDFDQFVYLLHHNTPTFKGTLKRETFRALWSSFKIDCYEVRHLDQKQWDLSRVSMAASPRSAYRKRPNRGKRGSVLDGSKDPPATEVAKAG